MKMNDLLKVTFGEKSNRIVTSFKKTISLGQYQTESVQADAEVIFDGNMSAIEREVVNHILLCTSEYSVVSHIYTKGQMSQQEFLDRRDKLENSAEAMLRKYESVTGNSRDVILHRIDEGKVETNQ